MKLLVLRVASLVLLLPLSVWCQSERRISVRVVEKASGQPVVGARYEVCGGYGPMHRRVRPLLSGVTGEEGEFEGRFLLENRELFVVRVTPRSVSQTFAGQLIDSKDLTPGQEDIEILLEPGRTVGGRVVTVGTGNPIAGARVHCGTGDTVTEADGSFVLGGIKEGAADVSLAVSAKGFGVLETLVPLIPRRQDPIELTLSKPWRSAVRVVDREGRPVSGVQVSARLLYVEPYSYLENCDFVGTSDEDGVAFIGPERLGAGSLPAGSVIAISAADPATGMVTETEAIAAETPDGRPELPGIPFDIPGEQRGAPASMFGPPPPQIAGTLTLGSAFATFETLDGFGNPVAGARVLIAPLIERRDAFKEMAQPNPTSGSVREGTTDANGQTVIDKLPMQWVTVEVRAKGYVTQMRLITPTDGSLLRIFLEQDVAPPGHDIPFKRSIAEAFSVADATGLPVMVSMTMDGERGNDWMAGHHFHDKELIRVAREMPSLLTSVFGRGGVPNPNVPHDEVDGVCTRYGHIPCAAHQEPEFLIADRLVGVTPFDVPRQIFVAPDGRILLQRTYYLSQREWIRMMMASLRVTRSDVALRLARERLPWVLPLLASEREADRIDGVTRLTALINAGDEHGVALLLGLKQAGVSLRVRIDLLARIGVRSLRFPAAALSPFLADAESLVRGNALRKLSVLSDLEDVVLVLSDALFRADPKLSFVGDLKTGVSETKTEAVVTRPLDGNRWRYVEALLRRRPADQVVGLDDVLDHGSDVARHQLFARLAAKPEDAGAVRRLMTRASSQRPFDAVALLALGRMVTRLSNDDAHAAVAVIAEQVTSENALVRELAIDALAASGDSSASVLLSERLTDQDQGVRTLAARALLEMGDERGVVLLLEALDDPRLGPLAEAALREHFFENSPMSPRAWRAWWDERSPR